MELRDAPVGHQVGAHGPRNAKGRTGAPAEEHFDAAAEAHQPVSSAQRQRHDGEAVVVPVDDQIGAPQPADEPADGQRRHRRRVLHQQQVGRRSQPHQPPEQHQAQPHHLDQVGQSPRQTWRSWRWGSF